jgi:hypothetical protein
MTTCCEKEPDPETNVNAPTAITVLADFKGTWEFQNFFYPGKGNYTSCPATYPKTQLTLKFNGTTCTITECGEVIAQDWPVTYEAGPKHIVIQKDLFTKFEFYIISYNNPVLVLRRDLALDGIVHSELTLKKVN